MNDRIIVVVICFMIFFIVEIIDGIRWLKRHKREIESMKSINRSDENAEAN